jgi:hypothetical protein
MGREFEAERKKLAINSFLCHSSAFSYTKIRSNRNQVQTLRFVYVMYVYPVSTARTARFSKKSIRSDVGEIKKMLEKLKKKSVLTPRNVREKSNTVIYYKTPTLTIKRCEIKKWDINLYLYICMFLRLSFLII